MEIILLLITNLVTLCLSINAMKRCRDIEDRLDKTKCILLWPEREGAWCPSGQDLPGRIDATHPPAPSIEVVQ